MTTSTKRNKGLYWLIFLVSTVACIYMLMYMDSWFWVTLPFGLTALVYALDAA